MKMIVTVIVTVNYLFIPIVIFALAATIAITSLASFTSIRFFRYCFSFFNGALSFSICFQPQKKKNATVLIFLSCSQWLNEMRRNQRGEIGRQHVKAPLAAALVRV